MDKKRYLTIKESVSLSQFIDVDISDDGQKVAFVKETTDWKDNTYRNHIYIYEKLKGKTYPLTTGKLESIQPLWSPDSKKLAYFSCGQIFIKSIDGNSNNQVTNLQEGVTAFRWSPDNKGIYYITSLPEAEEIKKRREIYGDIEFKDKEYRYNCLCYLDLGKVKGCGNNHLHQVGQNDNTCTNIIIGDGSFYIRDFEISNDCNKIVFTATPTPSMGDIDQKEIYIFNNINNNKEKLNIDAIIRGKAIFSPNSKKICYTRTIREKEYYEYNKKDVIIEIYDLDTGETIQPLKEFDSSVKPISWTSKGILINWKNRMDYLIGFLAGDGKINIVGDDDGSIIQLSSVTMNGNHIAYVKATTVDTFEVYLDGTKITNENKIYEGKFKSKKELVSWINCDGLRLEGVVSLPHDFDSSKTYPLLVRLGGAYRVPTFCKWFPVEQFVEKGFIVFEPNKRGYFGYGNDFMKGDYRKQGIAYYEDVISGVDMLIEKGIANREKIGIMGFSEGGYTSVFCSLYSDRFKAVSTYEGSNNWDTLYVSTSIPYFVKQILGATPWEDKEIYKKTSTMTYIKSANTPTLILHKDEDPVESLVNAYELYRGLKDMNVETELVIFKDNGHYSGSPGNNRAIMKLNLKWFSHYLLGESLDEFRSLI